MTIGTEDLHFFMLLSMQRTGDNISDTNFNFNSLYINKVYRTQLNHLCPRFLVFVHNVIFVTVFIISRLVLYQ